MKVLNNGVAKIAAVRSADWTYLFFGISGIVMAVMLETAVVREFFVNPIREAMGVALVTQLMLLPCLCLTIRLGAYKCRAHFLLYFCRIEDVDIKVLKEKYQIGFIDEYGVLFVEKKDARLFSDWEMKYTVRSARELEEELFTEDGVNAVNV